MLDRWRCDGLCSNSCDTRRLLQMNDSARSQRLTAVLPTRNRAGQAAAQLRLFRALSFPFPIVVADSSDVVDPALVEAAASSGATYLRYLPHIDLYAKLTDVVSAVETPFVVVVPDKKIT